MAKLPDGFSVQAIPINAALAEGRTEDAKTAIVELLRTGNADRVVQRLAAEMIRPPKRARGRRQALTRHWIEIGEQFHLLRDEGAKYEDVLRLLSEKFGYSETHVRKAVSEYDEVRAVAGAE
ncbi:hypothetical protein RJJ37_13040 [Rhizobium redzepovicii]|uniref:Uncharacterized protein n=1 Tax=Rhizobium redzepovicii TaxID=2867518 RepID=A0AAW8P0C8_9HYPH|nr:hypothetical protein [Rhizobium redzepovicii]MDR9760554.1 hypothetical protein [Rhizobium redzepovicii]